MVDYDKLVRDGIPGIIEASGKSCAVRVVEGEELFFYLDRKLDEEISEFRESRDLAELADILEVVVGLAESLGHSEKELFCLRLEKKDERGGFSQGIVLEKVS
ncbi:MAG: nucleoside triphosphate pyrophosphohydrolase [Thermoplasmatales archaeon]|nr:nucleoside triphosphate pyrophosphohydrolase [Thermoplasmatales archaeon]